MFKILIFRTEHIGDFALTLPMIGTLKKNFPKSEITAVVGPWNRDFVKMVRGIDKTIIFDNPLIKRDFSIKSIKLSEIWRLLKFIIEIRKTKFDLLVIPSTRKINGLFYHSIRARRKISGVGSDSIEEIEKKRCLRLISSGLGLKKISPRYDLHFSRDTKNALARILKERNLSEGDIVVVQPITYDTKNYKRNWGVEKWGELLKKVSNKNRKKAFLLMGVKDQKSELDKIVNIAGTKNVMNFAGVLTIDQLTYLIKRSKLFVGIDSGIQHIAAITRTPMISIFGETNEKVWGPSKEEGVIVKKSHIDLVSVEDVEKEFLKMIK